MVVPTLTIKAVQLYHTQAQAFFWHLSVEDLRLSAQGPSIQWCLHHLSKSVPILRSELTIEPGKN